jgi:hydrogenase-4 membrane subunit HyfE
VTGETSEQGDWIGGLSYRAAAWLAWSLAGLSVVMFVATVALTIRSLYVSPATQPSNSGATLGDLLLWIPFLAFPIVGALIASKRPTNAIGWICLVAGLFWMLIFLWDSIPSSVSAPVMIDALST